MIRVLSVTTRAVFAEAPSIRQSAAGNLALALCENRTILRGWCGSRSVDEQHTAQGLPLDGQAEVAEYMLPLYHFD